MSCPHWITSSSGRVQTKVELLCSEDGGDSIRADTAPPGSAFERISSTPAPVALWRHCWISHSGGEYCRHRGSKFSARARKEVCLQNSVTTSPPHYKCGKV